MLVDPSDPRAIADGLEAALSDEDLRCQLRERGPSQAAKFTWSACAAGTVDIYRQALRVERPR